MFIYLQLLTSSLLPMFQDSYKISIVEISILVNNVSFKHDIHLFQDMSKLAHDVPFFVPLHQ